jgi:thiol-disulfide isomerase/thioredoxin
MSYSTYKDLGKNSNNPQQISSNIPSVIRIESEQHRNQIINNNLVVVIYNYTDWCGPCKQSSPAFDLLSHKFKNGAMLVKENTDDELEGGPLVTGVPVFHYYIKGKYYEDLSISGGEMDIVEVQLVKILEKVALHK